jgi:hypothetical protein
MSEPNGPGTDSRAAFGQLTEDARPEQEVVAAPPDPWFEPGPKPDGYQSLAQDDPDAGQEADAPHDAEEWFLRTGRAGLLPASMTESLDEHTDVSERPDTAGAPPWAGERADQDVEEPPPWESGPWPGPGEERPAASPRSTAAGPSALSEAADDTGNWQAMAAAVAGILPLVLPGAVLGVLGLRRSRSTGTGRMASWLGIGLSAIWAVILIVVLAGVGGPSAPGCPATSQAAVTTVLHDMSAGAPVSTAIADLTKAISQENSAAAAVQQLPARDALVTLTTGLQRALAAVQASNSTSSYAALAKGLEADNAAVLSACKA